MSSSTNFTMRMEKPFRKLITDRAKAHNMSDSEYVKNCIMNAQIKPNHNPVDVSKVALNTSLINNNLEKIAIELKEANNHNNLSDYDFDKLLDYLLDMRLNLGELNNVYWS